MSSSTAILRLVSVDRLAALQLLRHLFHGQTGWSGPQADGPQSSPPVAELVGFTGCPSDGAGRHGTSFGCFTPAACLYASDEHAYVIADGRYTIGDGLVDPSGQEGHVERYLLFLRASKIMMSQPSRRDGAF